MSPVSPVGNSQYLTEIDIRMYLRDADPKANELIDDLEFSTEEVRSALTFTTDYFNEQPPDIAHFDYTAFPWRFHLLQGTAAQLLFIAANRYRRNFMVYNIPGATISPQNKAPEYDAAGQKLWDEYKRFVKSKKTELNIQRGFGPVG